MDSFRTRIGQWLAAYIERPVANYTPFAVTPLEHLRTHLQPGDIVLVEGKSRVSAAIKFLTHSTWSHSAFYVGPGHPDGELIEADLQKGVIHVPLSKYDGFNLRICRPVGLRPQDLNGVLEHMTESLGRTYDLKNIFDLMRYLLPTPPVPQRFRRRMLALGSGDPTRAICSTLIAEAFQKVSYPILPRVESDPDCAHCGEILHIRHYSLFAPRDFDLSPYFRVVKPTIETGFDHHGLVWNHQNEQTAPSMEIAGKTSA